MLRALDGNIIEVGSICELGSGEIVTIFICEERAGYSRIAYRYSNGYTDSWSYNVDGMWQGDKREYDILRCVNLRKKSNNFSNAMQNLKELELKYNVN